MNHSEPRTITTTCPKWETICVAVGMFFFLVFNVLTASRYPFVWIDEVMYTDPAVNLHLGNGFTSSAWYVQHASEFWAGNVPLHSALLFLWIKLFGFSITAVRSINYVYLLAASWLLWRSVLRLNLITKSWLRLALLALLASGYSMIFAYRSGRPDCLTLLLVCAAVYIYSFYCWRQKIFGLMALGCMMPWAGLQLLPLLAVAGGLLVLYVGRKIILPMMSIYGGVALGLATLFWFYTSHHVFQQFLSSVRQHTSLGFFGWLAQGKLHHSNLVPKDFSFIVLFIFGLLLSFRWLRKGTMRSMLSFGLVYSVVLTVALIFSGKFPTYYGWMTYVPLSLCLCATLDGADITAGWRRLGGVFFAAAILISLLLHGVTAIADWPDRNYAHLERLIRKNIKENDWMYGEFGTYYAGKNRAAKIFMPPYASAFLPEEKALVSVLVIAPTNYAEVTNVIGGNWVPTGEKLTPTNRGFWASRRNMGFLSMQNYDLEVYRRTDRTSP